MRHMSDCSLSRSLSSHPFHPHSPSPRLETIGRDGCEPFIVVLWNVAINSNLSLSLSLQTWKMEIWHCIAWAQSTADGQPDERFCPSFPLSFSHPEQEMKMAKERGLEGQGGLAAFRSKSQRGVGARKGVNKMALYSSL